jgi:hypothetical protein
MAYNRVQARALCTATEYALFEASLADQIRAHSHAELLGKIRRVRVLRDKYRDLYKRQRLAVRARTGSKKGEGPDANVRTSRKAQLFAEALKRLEGRAADLERVERAKAASEARARAQARARVAAKARAKAKAKRRAARPVIKGAKSKSGQKSGFIDPGAERASHGQMLQKTRTRAVQGHVRASGRRVQARRDQRR